MEKLLAELKLLFVILPGRSALVLPDPPAFTVAAVGNDYLRTAGRTREELIAKGLFDTFPNNPEDPDRTGENRPGFAGICPAAAVRLPYSFSSL